MGLGHVIWVFDETYLRIEKLRVENQKIFRDLSMRVLSIDGRSENMKDKLLR